MWAEERALPLLGAARTSTSAQNHGLITGFTQHGRFIAAASRSESAERTAASNPQRGMAYLAGPKPTPTL